MANRSQVAEYERFLTPGQDHDGPFVVTFTTQGFLNLSADAVRALGEPSHVSIATVSPDEDQIGPVVSLAPCKAGDGGAVAVSGYGGMVRSRKFAAFVGMTVPKKPRRHAATIVNGAIRVDLGGSYVESEQGNRWTQ